MLKTLLPLAISLCLSVNAFTQDIITKTSGEEIKAKILEVSTSEVKYRLYDNPSSPLFTILKSEILIIKYENGSKDIFLPDLEAKIKEKEMQVEELKIKARKDAQLQYKAKNTGSFWTAASTVVFTPFLGIIPAAITATEYPLYENLDISDPKLLKNENYVLAYSEEAHKKKRKKVWTHYSIGSAIWLVGTILLSIK